VPLLTAQILNNLEISFCGLLKSDSIHLIFRVFYGKLLHKSGLGFEPKVGMVCATRFTQDDMWYRAKIIGVTPDQNVSIHEYQSELGK
jgi:hypothetical protein